MLAGDLNGVAFSRLIATDPVRVFVQVPQDIAPSVPSSSERMQVAAEKTDPAKPTQ